MQTPTIQIADAQAALRARLVAGGALPYNWHLYVYQQDKDGNWSHTLLGQGSQGQPLPLNRTGAQLNGMTLVWSVATATLDTDATTIDVTVELYDNDDLVGKTPADPHDVSPEGSQFYVGAKISTGAAQ